MIATRYHYEEIHDILVKCGIRGYVWIDKRADSWAIQYIAEGPPYGMTHKSVILHDNVISALMDFESFDRDLFCTLRLLEVDVISSIMICGTVGISPDNHV
jgi:hypothetical protein